MTRPDDTKHERQCTSTFWLLLVYLPFEGKLVNQLHEKGEMTNSDSSKRALTPQRSDQNTKRSRIGLKMDLIYSAAIRPYKNHDILYSFDRSKDSPINKIFGSLYTHKQK